MGQTPVLWGLRDKHLPSAGSGPRPFCHLSADKLHKLFIHQAPGRPHSSFKSKPSKPRFISTHCVSRTRGPATLAVPCATQQGRWLSKFSVPREIIAWLWDSRVQNLTDRSFFSHCHLVLLWCILYKLIARVQITKYNWKKSRGFSILLSLCKQWGPFNHSPHKREFKSWKQPMIHHLVRTETGPFLNHLVSFFFFFPFGDIIDITLY